VKPLGKLYVNCLETSQIVTAYSQWYQLDWTYMFVTAPTMPDSVCTCGIAAPMTKPEVLVSHVGLASLSLYPSSLRLLPLYECK